MADWSDRLNLVCFEPLKYERPWTLETYRRIGGYEAWEKILATKPPQEQVIEAVIQTAPFSGFAPALNALGGLIEALDYPARRNR